MVISLPMKDVYTHSRNQLRELYYQPATETSQIGDNWLIIVRELVLPLRLYTFPNVERCIQGLDQNDTGSYVFCENCLYKQVVWNCFCMKLGYLLYLPPMQSTHKCVQCPGDGLHRKGCPFGMREEICRPQRPCADSSQGDLHPLPKCHYAAALTLSFNRSPFHQTVLVFLLSLHVPSYNQHAGELFFPKDGGPRDVTGEGICACHS